MSKNLHKYRPIVGNNVIDNIYKKAKNLQGKHFVAISSTHQGGGVAEMLNSIIILFNELGIKFGWRIIHGSPDFFNITKKFHNALQGEKVCFSKREKEFYLKTNRRFAAFTHLDHDLVIVHDPQPLAMIDYCRNSQPWILRLHIDLSRPGGSAWNFLKTYINKYDHVVVSEKKFKKNLDVPQSVIYPAIDPCSPKNKNLSAKEIDRLLDRAGIDCSKPLITQISRYDKWKDPEGVIKVYEAVKKRMNCRLVLLGNLAMDDPEGAIIYNAISKKYGQRSDISLLVNVGQNDLLVNALQRRSDVIIQKSLKEGFGLTVTEALYKGTPVVGSNIGGIVHQIKPGFNGYLHDPLDYSSFADSIVKILKDGELRRKLGDNGRRYVTENFLITRLLADWLDLFTAVLASGLRRG